MPLKRDEVLCSITRRISFGFVVSTFPSGWRISCTIYGFINLPSFAKDEIAAKAIKLESGARSLRAIMEKVLLDPMKDIPSNKTIVKCIVNKKAVQGKAEIRYEHRQIEVMDWQVCADISAKLDYVAFSKYLSSTAMKFWRYKGVKLGLYPAKQLTPELILLRDRRVSHYQTK